VAHKTEFRESPRSVVAGQTCRTLRMPQRPLSVEQSVTAGYENPGNPAIPTSGIKIDFDKKALLGDTHFGHLDTRNNLLDRCELWLMTTPPCYQ